MDASKLTPSHVRKVFRARRRWAEDRTGIVLGRWPVDGTFPAELGRLLHVLDIACVVDVGAHAGGFGRLVRRLGFAGDIVSFEPATVAFDALERTIRTDSRWRGHKLGLGSTRGWMELDIYPQTQLNSLRRPRPTQAHQMHPESVEMVEVARLDDVWSELIPAGDKILLKTDAQGFDLEVMKGAATSLSACVALQVEVSDLPLYDETPSLLEVVSYLHERSFHITGLFPVSRTPVNGLRVIDFDATFVHATGP